MENQQNENVSQAKESLVEPTAMIHTPDEHLKESQPESSEYGNKNIDPQPLKQEDTIGNP